jgi:hypothetical protein
VGISAVAQCYHVIRRIAATDRAGNADSLSMFLMDLMIAVGSVATITAPTQASLIMRLSRSFDTEESGEDPGLSAPIVLRNPEDLAFSDHLRCFDTFDHVACCCQCARSLHRSPAPLDVPMV